MDTHPCLFQEVEKEETQKNQADVVEDGSQRMKVKNQGDIVEDGSQRMTRRRLSLTKRKSMVLEDLEMQPSSSKQAKINTGT